MINTETNNTACASPCSPYTGAPMRLIDPYLLPYKLTGSFLYLETDDGKWYQGIFQGLDFNDDNLIILDADTGEFPTNSTLIGIYIDTITQCYEET